MDRLKRFNAGREPERLLLKYQAMRADAFAFLRGTCHLFYDDLARDAVLDATPATWICGDLHLQNFGSYKGDNRLVYFDINDFDEAALAPCGWELARMLASILVGAQTLHLDETGAVALCHLFLGAYADSLVQGKARWIERATARGMIKDVLRDLRRRVRAEFLDFRTDRRDGMRVLQIDGRRTLPVRKIERRALQRFLAEFARSRADPAFYRLLDVARRIAGTGSLGVPRYLLLIEGRGSPDGNHLIDLKQARPSALAPHLPLPQPHWVSEADRVVRIQQRMQAIAPAFLEAVHVDGVPYVMRELQPSQDKVNLSRWNDRIRRLENVLHGMGQLLAWAQLRSSGRDGADCADRLIEFGQDRRWVEPLLSIAMDARDRTVAQWQEFTLAFDDGAFHR